MRIITTILLFLSISSFAQVSEVIPAEYSVDFIKKDGSAHTAVWITPVGLKVSPITGKFAEGNGGLYDILLRDTAGNVFAHGPKSTSLKFLQYDADGKPFKAKSIECHLQTYIAVRDDGTVCAMNYNTQKWFGTDPQKVLDKWTKIPGQPAVKFKSVVKGGSNGNGVLVAVAEDGTVYTVNDNSTTWIKKALPGPVEKVYASVNNFYIATIGGMPFGWGNAKYLNNTVGTITNYVALAPYWGITAPPLDIAVNDNTIHFITAEGRLFGYGDNAQGEVGNGWQLVDKVEYKGTRYIWNWIMANQPGYQQTAFVAKPVQIRSDVKFRRVFGGGYYAFYKYAQDISGNLYSWGRNKSAVLYSTNPANTKEGLAVSNESNYPNALDVTVPTQVDPFSVTVPSPGLFIPGIVSAGPDQKVGSTSTILTGVATPTRGKNFSFGITTYKWRQLSGTASGILSPDSAITEITALNNGTYSFQLLATDINNGTMADTVVVAVEIINKPPVVEAWCNKVAIDKSILLKWKATDPDGKIVSAGWEKVSGPAGDSVVNVTDGITEVTFAAPGEFTYRLSATDDKGATGQATVTFFVYEVGDVFVIIRK
jgi:hypothetical protein